MNAHGFFEVTKFTSDFVLKAYLGDLSDAELMHRPAPGCNHLAWQLGHLISSNAMLLESVVPGSAPELPAGFADKHSKATTSSDDPAQFYTKSQYMDLYDKVQSAASAAAAKLTEADLDAPAPESFRDMFPTMGHMLSLLATHSLMHAGQFVPVRRSLGKPVVI